MKINWFLILFLLLVSCNSKKDKQENTLPVSEDILQLMVNKNIATDALHDTLLVNIDNVIRERNNIEPFTGLIYLLNVDCSFCVVRFLNFMSFLEKEDVNLPVMLIVEEEGAFYE